jgi:hypothetical protein
MENYRYQVCKQEVTGSIPAGSTDALQIEVFRGTRSVGVSGEAWCGVPAGVCGE